MHRPYLAVMLIGALLTPRSAAPSAPLSPEIIKLAAIRRHMTAEVKRNREMMCLETIERRNWDAKGKLTHADRLQIEVAFVGSRELFAWPGDEQFSTHTPAELSGAGLGSSGELVAQLASVFNARGSAIRPASSSDHLLRFDFEVPIFGSGFQVTGLTGSARVATTGSVWVDAQTLGVMRMESRAKDIPAQTSVSEVFRSVDYSRVHLAGGATHLAPQRAAVTLIDLDRSVHLNRIQFSHCRGFGATSQLSFDDAPAASTVRVALPASVRTRLPGEASSPPSPHN